MGPDLQGIDQRRTEGWIIDFVQNSQGLVAAGDSTAVALFEEFFRIPMPDQELSDNEVREIISFISASPSDAAAVMTPTQPQAASEAEIVLGQDLFQGTTRLANGGAACNSCHEVTNDAVIGGGVLARELTTVFSRLGGPGVRAILGSAPFPVMQRAYLDKALTDEEIVALVGFLQRADEQKDLHQPRDYGVKLFGAGLVGMVIIFGLSALVFRGRKRGSVNQAIFDRQVKSI